MLTIIKKCTLKVVKLQGHLSLSKKLRIVLQFNFVIIDQTLYDNNINSALIKISDFKTMIIQHS